MKKTSLLALTCWLLWQGPVHGQQISSRCIAPAVTHRKGGEASAAPGGGGGVDPAPLCLNRRNVKINVHYILRNDGSGNFNEFNDGVNEFVPIGHSTPPQYSADPQYNGYAVAEGIVWAANVQLDNNDQMWSPPNNTIPKQNTRLNFVLQGVYFHRRSDLYNYASSNQGGTGNGLASQDHFDQLGVNKADEINVIVLGQDDDPDNEYLGDIANSLGYTSSRNWVKLLNVWRINWSCRINNASSNVSWPGGQLLSHEIGHLLGLSHPNPQYGGDTCADTDGVCGNNMMDYCSGGYALTPCQIGIMQQQLNTYWGNYIGSCGCIMPHAFMDLTTCTTGQITGIWMDGRGSFPETAHSIEIAELDGNSNPVLGTVSTFSYNQEASRVDLSTLYSFLVNKTYRVKLTVSNYCGSNETSKIFTTTYMCAPVERSAANTATGKDGNAKAAALAEINIFPNPAHGSADVFWQNGGGKIVPMQLRDLTGRVVWKGQLTGTQARIPLNGVKTGIYSLEVQTDGGTVNRRLVVE